MGFDQRGGEPGGGEDPAAALPPPPEQGEQRPRRGRTALVIVVVVLCLVGVVIGSVAYEQHRKQLRWDDARIGLETFPIPAGFREADRQEQRPYCPFTASCGSTLMGMNVVADRGQTKLTCADLQTITRSWWDFVADDPQHDYAGGGCIVGGQVRGHGAQVYLLDGAAGLRVVIFP